MAQTVKTTTTNTRNRIYGIIETQTGCLVLDENFIKEQIETSISSKIEKKTLFYAFSKMFANPNISWLSSKEEYLEYAEAFWIQSSASK